MAPRSIKAKTATMVAARQLTLIQRSIFALWREGRGVLSIYMAKDYPGL